MRWDRATGEGLNPEIVDWPSLRSRVGGDLVLLRELVSMFAAEYPLMLKHLEAALERGESSTVEKLSHKLKGSLIQFSARAASATAARLENMGKLNALEGAGGELHRLKQELEELVQALNAVVPQRDTE